MTRCRAGIVGTLLLALGGCVNTFGRPELAQVAEREKDLAAVRTVGDVTEVNNVSPLQVSGIGLVSGLSGTGGSPKGPERQLLEQYLRKQKVERVTELLDSPDNALVLVTALIPVGSRRGDRFDVQVSLPPNSKATSLAGGYLQDCALRDHTTTQQASPEYSGANRLLLGHVCGKARGALLVGFGGEKDEPAALRTGRVWPGAVSLIDRPFQFILRSDDRSSFVANAVAERLNYSFQDDPQRMRRLTEQQRRVLLLGDAAEQLNAKFDPSSQGRTTAKVKTKEIIEVGVPYGYRFNPEHYLRVARFVPLREEAEAMARYRGRLQAMVLDPGETVRAAMRLEALGKDSMPALRDGLRHEHALVRFACAEALAYLGSTAGADELARLAREQPLLTGHCLLALANLNENVCRTNLAELLAADDAELRCGAFLALRLIDERDARLGGEQLNDAFWLHRVAPGSPKLVNFAVGKRAEVVLFGEGIAVTGPVRTLVGQEFAVTREADDDRVTVSRISAQTGKRYKQCPPALDDVIRTLSELGGDYPDVVDLLRKLGDAQALNCPVRAGALPAEVTLDVLVEAGRNPSLLRDAAPVRPVSAEATER